MHFPTIGWLFVRFFSRVGSTLVLLLIFGYTFAALILVYWPPFIDNLVFLNHFANPFVRNLSDIAAFGLDAQRTTCVTVRTNDGVNIGVWYMKPREDSRSPTDRIRIVYLHGNSGTRATPHRIALYDVLLDAGFEVVTFDYRGYADSKCPPPHESADHCFPSEKRLLIDSLAVFDWAINHGEISKSNVVVWGHSLGGGAATNLVRALCQNRGECPRALVLESTFNDVIDAALIYPLAWGFQVHEGLLNTLKGALILRDFAFNTTSNLSFLNLPILMLHAADDWIVPASLSQHAFNTAAVTRPSDWPDMSYKLFDRHFSYGHRELHRAPDLIPTVKKFLSNGKL